MNLTEINTIMNRLHLLYDPYSSFLKVAKSHFPAQVGSIPEETMKLAMAQFIIKVW